MHVKTFTADPLQFFRKLRGEKNVSFLTSATGSGWGTLIAFNPRETFSSRGGDAESFTSFVQKHTTRGRTIIGYLSYDLGYTLHRVKKTARDDLHLPDIFFHAYDNHITFSGPKGRMHYNTPGFPEQVAEIQTRMPLQPASGRSVNFSPVITRDDYDRAHEKIKRYIYEGEVYQINYTHRLEGRTDMHPRNLFLEVIRTNPVDFLAYLEGSGFDILSASPELFVRTRNRRIETCPIKGTRPRGRTRASDARYRTGLLKNRKEAAELNMITDLLRNDLGKICEIGSVTVEGSRLLSRCPTVWHTYSKITGRISEKHSPVQALLSMVPGGSITGCPKKRAMEIIDEIEPTTRSVYTGAIGCIHPGGDIDFSIAIRTILKKKERLYLQVGGGIVYDSNKGCEFRETIAKARSFMKILA